MDRTGPSGDDGVVTMEARRTNGRGDVKALSTGAARGGPLVPAVPVREAVPTARHRFRLSTRVRLVLIAVAALFIAMLIGGAGLLYLLEDNVETSAAEAAAARASAIADAVSSIGLSEAAATVVALPRDGPLVQIIDPRHTVFSASDQALETTAMVDAFPAAGAEVRTEATDLRGQPGEWAVVARGVRARGATYVVQVATPISTAREIVDLAARYLFLVMPALLIAAAVALWLVVGRTLNAVERIRRNVAGIDAQNLAARVEVPRTRDEIAALAVTMNAMLDRLQQSNSAQRAFISDASHELRSPLATITAATELAATAEEPRRSQLLRTTALELVRLRELAENLMTLARLDSSGLPMPLADVDLDDLVDQERTRLQTASGKRVTAALEPVRTRGDAAALARALRNLVDNADRHARSTIRLSVTIDATEAIVRVDNDGPLITEDERQRIFDRFVRLDESRSRDAGGSGLGLAIVQKIVQHHGGSVAVVDSPDGWCRFEIRLPATP